MFLTKLPSKILLICLSGMGNWLLFTPSLRHYRKIFPNAQIDCCIRWSYLQDLLKVDSDIKNIWLFDEKKYQSIFSRISFIKKLKNEKYDLSICVFPSNRWQYNALAWGIGAKTKINFSYPQSRGLTLSRLQETPLIAETSIHDLEQNVRMAELITNTPLFQPYIISTPIPEIDDTWAKEYLKSVPAGMIIALHPSIDPNQPYKPSSQLVVTLFTELIKKLRSDIKANILLIGGPNEAEIVNSINQNCIDKCLVASNQDILKTAALIKHCKLLINIDSGLGHLASVFNTPSITLLGPIMSSRTRPFNMNQYFIQNVQDTNVMYGYPFYTCINRADNIADSWFSKISLADIIDKVKEINTKN